MFQIKGKLSKIGNTQQVSDKFSKREFVVVVTEQGKDGKDYSTPVKLQTTNAKTSVLDNFKVGQEVSVSFNLRGFEAKSGEVYTNLDAWKIDSLSAPQPSGFNSPSGFESSDEPPF